MEDRVKQTLEKEHSKRFRLMCHRNENISQQNKVLIQFYEREKKKSLYAIELQEADLRKQAIQYSQEKLVNGMLNDLTDIAFERKNASQLTMDKTESVETISSQSDSVPRYLRMETNPFHPSEMSLGSSDDHLTVSTSLTSQPLATEKVISQETVGSVVCGGGTEECLPGTSKMERATGRIDMDSAEFIEGVASKLRDVYDLDRLKLLTQVMLKTVQSKERARYEDKVRLLCNLHRYFNEESQRSSKGEGRRSAPVETKQNNDNTFLFLKSDRQEEIKAENEKKSRMDMRKEQQRQALDSRRRSLDDRITQLFLPPISNSSNENAAMERRISSIPGKDLGPVDHHGGAAGGELDDLMTIYLRLGQANSAILGMPRAANTANSRGLSRSKQRSWLRSELGRRIPIVTKDGVQDLRVVLKNCRYLRFPKDMQEPENYSL